MTEKAHFIKHSRILCVITQGELGGAQQFVIQLARHLNRDAFDLRVVWGRDGGSALAQHLPMHTSTALAHHLVRAISPWDDLSAVRELRNMMAAYQPDVVLCISSKAGFVGALAAQGLRSQFPNMRVVYRIGGWTFNDPWPAWKKKAYLWLEKFSAHWKDVIVVNNRHDFEQARALGIRPRGEVTLIHNGIDPYLDMLSREQARAELDRRVSEHYRTMPYEHLVGTIANLYPAKDLDILIRAAAHTPETVRFVVIGEGAERAALSRLIAEHGLERRFFLIGSLPNAYRYLPALDVFVLSSMKEGFPWAVLEAMAAKVPVVATRVGAIPEMLEDGISGILVEPGAPEQIADGIQTLLANDRLRQELAIRAHQNLLARFSLRDMIAQYEKLFTS